MKKLLLIAYHFPPQSESSGYLRALKFCRYLPDFGWQPTVLTVHPRAYERVNSSQRFEIPSSLVVHRSFALDTRRHLSLKGRYLRSTAIPDRWSTWAPAAIASGFRLVRRQNHDLIMSTFPIATAVLIAWALHRLTGKPWIADLRDSMTEPDYPRDRQTWQAYRWLERKAAHEAARLVFTAPSAVRMYADRYPGAAERCSLIFNGYDEEDFAQIAASSPPSPPTRIRLVHMGLLYPIERDPRAFFRAISQLLRKREIDSGRLRIELRSSGYETQYQAMLKEEGIESVVHLLPPLPYQEALRDMAAADGLLLFQAACCNHQIPAKLFEYLRLRKPILALTSPEGDTARILQDVGAGSIADLADASAIERTLPDFLRALESGVHSLPDPTAVSNYSRRGQAAALADLLNSVIAGARRA